MLLLRQIGSLHQLKTMIISTAIMIIIVTTTIITTLTTITG